MCASAQALTPASPRPDTLMSALTTEVMATWRQDKAAGRKTDLEQLVKARIVPAFDFPRMTSLALGRNWRLASPGQQTVLTAQFQLLLVRTYSLVLAEFRDQAIDYEMADGPAGGSSLSYSRFTTA
jgi:phospholipid transport system substrate-binding protein